jgi:DMSO/TMAO reductase YedYZ molybdopterin-dependent catalytic subunit
VYDNFKRRRHEPEANPWHRDAAMRRTAAASHSHQARLAKNLEAIEVTDKYPGGYWENQGSDWFAGV